MIASIFQLAVFDVFQEVLAEARQYPLVMWHGFGQFSKTWETTPDGWEGFQNIFLRRRFPVYLPDQPRRGNAGRSTVAAAIEPTPDEQQWFGTFRIGIWPDYFEGVQFAQDPATLDQYFRAMTPSIGNIDIAVNVEAVSALFDKIGPAVLVTHSHSGGMGWLTAIKNQQVKAIVSYEPGARTNWHYHPGGQILLATGGVGYYQEKGQPLMILRKGDLVKCLPDVPHWHGASPDTLFIQVAITNTANGPTVWLEAVTDEEYSGR